jgi:hypothetical protein
MIEISDCEEQGKKLKRMRYNHYSNSRVHAYTCRDIVIGFYLITSKRVCTNLKCVGIDDEEGKKYKVIEEIKSTRGDARMFSQVGPTGSQQFTVGPCENQIKFMNTGNIIRDTYTCYHIVLQNLVSLRRFWLHVFAFLQCTVTIFFFFF